MEFLIFYKKLNLKCLQEGQISLVLEMVFYNQKDATNKSFIEHLKDVKKRFHKSKMPNKNYETYFLISQKSHRWFNG